MSLSSHTVLITGSSSGIGLACARLFAEQGARLSLAARRVERLEKLAEEIKAKGGSCIFKKTDVSDREQVEAWVKETIATFGRVDCLINNAGVGCVGRIADINPELAHQTFEINWFGALYSIQAVIAQMKNQKSGHIINVSSIIGKRSVPEIGVYCATKFALNALSDALRMEVREEGIEVTTICPGLTETEFADNQIREPGEKPMRAKMRGQSSEQVAHSILRAYKRKRREIHLTASGKFLVGLERLSPALVDQILRWQHVFYGKDQRNP